MEITTGKYVKLGRVWFKIKETSETANDLSNVNILNAIDSSSSSENTDAYFSEHNLNQNVIHDEQNISNNGK